MTAIAVQTTATVAAEDAAIPTPRKDPNAPWKGQTKYAADLMRRLWGHDPETCDELVASLYDLNRVQLGRVVDNLMWTLANQPRPINAAQGEHIRALWARKMSKPLDAAAEQRLVKMTEEQAQALITKMQATPDRAR